MKLSKILEKFPNLKDAEIHADGYLSLPLSASDMICSNQTARYESAEKVLSIIRHHVRRLDARINFTHVSENTFAVITSCIAQAAVGLAIKSPKDSYSKTFGEALAATRAFEDFNDKLMQAGEWDSSTSISRARTKVSHLITEKVFQ